MCKMGGVAPPLLASTTYLPLAIVLRVGDADPCVEADEHVHARAGRAQRLQRRRLVNEERVARQATAGAARVVVGGEQLHHLHPLHEARAHDRLVGILLGEQQQRPARPVHVCVWVGEGGCAGGGSGGGDEARQAGLGWWRQHPKRCMDEVSKCMCARVGGLNEESITISEDSSGLPPCAPASCCGKVRCTCGGPDGSTESSARCSRAGPPEVDACAKICEPNARRAERRSVVQQPASHIARRLSRHSVTRRARGDSPRVAIRRL